MREQALLEKEREFALKEADYKSLVRMRDSLLAAYNDTLKPAQWPAKVIGKWSSSVVCNESSCSDYVIGDQRSDVWEFFQDSTGIYAKVINNNNNRLLRIFSGNMENETIHLNFSTDTGAVKPVKISVALQSIDSSLMKGTQTITIWNNTNNNCAAKFSVELIRKPN